MIECQPSSLDLAHCMRCSGSSGEQVQWSFNWMLLQVLVKARLIICIFIKSINYYSTWETCFSCCRPLSSITIEAIQDWRELNRIHWLSHHTSLNCDSTNCCSSYFSHCRPLSSITFECSFQMKRIEVRAFQDIAFPSLVIPPTICCIACRAFRGDCRSLFSVVIRVLSWSTSAPGIITTKHVRRILRLTSGLCGLSECLIWPLSVSQRPITRSCPWSCLVVSMLRRYQTHESLFLN
jgi:hypothetical protein